MTTEAVRKVEPPALLSSALFYARLAQTIAWCKRTDHHFRSSELAPKRDFAEIRSKPERVEVVKRIAEERQRILKANGKAATVRYRTLAGGALLLYAPDENLFDGAAECQSQGFFDVNNVPPWDCWVAYCHPYLISWIPSASVPLAQAGIDVNPEECIFWAERIWNLVQLL